MKCPSCKLRSSSHARFDLCISSECKRARDRINWTFAWLLANGRQSFGPTLARLLSWSTPSVNSVGLQLDGEFNPDTSYAIQPFRLTLERDLARA